jgi:hypothetical protein
MAGRRRGLDRARDRQPPRRRDRPHVALGHRLHVAPQVVVQRAEHPPRARHQAGRVDEVARTPLVHPHRQPRVLPYERARRAGVVEVDVRQEQVAQVGDLEAGGREALAQRAEMRAGAAVDERGLAVGQHVRGEQLAMARAGPREVERQHGSSAAARTARTMRP